VADGPTSGGNRYTASTYFGELPTRDHPDAGEGTEGSLTAALEQLFVDNKVDVSMYGHIHSYNRMFPVKDNGSVVRDVA
jgi:predicted phosphohydrolase